MTTKVTIIPRGAEIQLCVGNQQMTLTEVELLDVVTQGRLIIEKKRRPVKIRSGMRASVRPLPHFTD